MPCTLAFCSAAHHSAEVPVQGQGHPADTLGLCSVILHSAGGPKDIQQTNLVFALQFFILQQILSKDGNTLLALFQTALDLRKTT